MTIDSYRFLPRSFRPFYEGRGPFPGEGDPVWAPFPKRLAGSRIALLTSAGMYLQGSQSSFDLDGERARPEWGDPTWRVIPSSMKPDDVGVAHLHLNEDDIHTDPEVALPVRALDELVSEGVVGSAAANHLSVMGYQDRRLEDWRRTTVPAIIDHLRTEQADGLVLAPA